MTNTRKYFSEIDGLRALAITLVIIFHAKLVPFRGGFLGVDLFFVISGFLITEILLRERLNTGKIRITAFYGRRAKRLLPALFTMLASLVIVEHFYPDFAASSTILQGIAGTFFYVQNWVLMISSKSSYFATTYPSPLLHTWSLAVEEQFYILFPALILFLTRFRSLSQRKQRRKIRSKLFWGLYFVIVVSFVSMVTGSFLHLDTNELYYNTFFRAFELLIGSCVALKYIYRTESQNWDNIDSRLKAEFLSLGSLLVIIILAILLNDKGEVLYRGGLFVFALFSGLLLHSLVNGPPTIVSRCLSLRPVRWIGKISYSLYLWHWPVIVFLSGKSLNLPNVQVAVIEILTSFVLAAISYYLIETPLRHASYKKMMPKVSFAMLPAIVLVGSGFVYAQGNAGYVISSIPANPFDLPRTELLNAQKPNIVGIIGDSVMYQESVALEYGLISTGSFEIARNGNYAYPGWGLTQKVNLPELYKSIKLRHINTLFLMWTMDNTYIARHSASAYLSLIQSFVEGLQSAGVKHLFFISQPPLPGPSYSAYIDHFPGVNSIGQEGWTEAVRDIQNKWANLVSYIPASRSLEGAHGYATFLPDVTNPKRSSRIRQLDGLHLCVNGAARYTSAILSWLVSKQIANPPNPGWLKANWTKDSRFDHILGGQPPGQCPNGYSD